MANKTINETPQLATAAVPKKQAYKTPLLIVYGAVRQFTQGTGGNGNDSQITPSNNTKQSDRAFKTNSVRIGTHPLNIGLYLFDYKPEFQASAGYGRQFGVMADEVESVMPAAVVMHPDGYKRVNYAMLGIDLSARRVH